MAAAQEGDGEVAAGGEGLGAAPERMWQRGSCKTPPGPIRPLGPFQPIIAASVWTIFPCRRTAPALCNALRRTRVLEREKEGVTS